MRDLERFEIHTRESTGILPRQEHELVAVLGNGSHLVLARLVSLDSKAELTQLVVALNRRISDSGR